MGPRPPRPRGCERVARSTSALWDLAFARALRGGARTAVELSYTL